MSNHTKYKIRTCPTSDVIRLEMILNEMSQKGWELYGIHEIENEDSVDYCLIFFTENFHVVDSSYDELDVYDVLGFKTQMERIMNPACDPYSSCVELQHKIKEKREKISAIKSQIDNVDDKRRFELNDEMSKHLKELSSFKEQLKCLVSPDYFSDSIGEEKLVLCISEELTQIVDPDFEAVLISEIVKLRADIAAKLGYIIPKIKFEIDEKLKTNEFEIKLRGTVVLKDFAFFDFSYFDKNELKMDSYPHDSVEVYSESQKKNVIWIPNLHAKTFWQAGKSAQNFITQAIETVCIKNIENIFDYSDLNRYIEKVTEENLFLVENILPDAISVFDLKYILSSLIKEKVSIKDIVFIFEKLNDFATVCEKNEIITNLRISMAKQISYNLSNSDNNIEVFKVNEQLLRYFEEKSKDSVVKISKDILIQFIEKLETKRYSVSKLILLVPLQLRHFIFEIMNKFVNNIYVISAEEIDVDYRLEVLEVL